MGRAVGCAFQLVKKWGVHSDAHFSIGSKGTKIRTMDTLRSLIRQKSMVRNLIVCIGVACGASWLAPSTATTQCGQRFVAENGDRQRDRKRATDWGCRRRTIAVTWAERGALQELQVRKAIGSERTGAVCLL